MKKLILFIVLLFSGTIVRAQVPVYVDTSGLLAWYPFDTNANNAYSLTMDNGVLYGDAAYGPDRYGIPNRSYLGDGTSGIDIPVNNFVTGNGARSVAAWYKMPLPAPSGNREIFATGDNSAVGHRFGINTDVTWIGWESVGLGVDCPLPVDSAWHHLVITYSTAGTGSTSIKTYFDGVIRATTFIGGTVGVLNTPVNPIHCIGSLFMPISYGSWLYSWIGEIDDMGVWDREITPCDVSYLYYGGNSTLKFANGHRQDIIVCRDVSFSLNSILAVNDSDVGLVDDWSVYLGPANGSLVATFAATSTGSTMTPTGLSYTSTGSYAGPDSFKVIVKDCMGTTDTTTVVVTIDTVLSPGVISGPGSLCSGSSITLTETVSGGVWSSGSTDVTVTGSVVTGVTAGTSVISYSVSNICGASFATKTITINATPPAPSVTGTSVYCQYTSYVAPVATGTNILWYTTATGGVGTTVTPVVNTNVPGIYNYYVSQSGNGCESPRTPFTITVNPQPAPPVITDVPDNYCLGQTFVPFTIVSGTGVLWYTAATGGTGSPISPTVNTAVSGSYTYWATQTVLGCESPRVAVTVTVSFNISAGFNMLTKLGCTADTVFFTNTSTGTVDYSWTFGDVSPVSVDVNPMHVYLSQGTYTVTLYASNPPCMDSSRQVVTLEHPLQAMFSADTNLICQGQSITFANASIATGPRFLWNFGDGTTATVPNPTHTFPHTGVYNIVETVTDFIPCTDTASVTVSVDSTSPIAMSITDEVICKGTYVTFTGAYSSIGNTGITWNFGDGDSIRNQNPVIYAYQNTGKFTITASATYRVCDDTSVSRTITVLPLPDIYLGPDTTICKGGSPITLLDRINATNPEATWLWSTGETASQISITEPGLYTATVKVDGCSNSGTVKVINDCYMNIPNAFSPNNDGVNDFFYPLQSLSSGITSFSMVIYNRWGQQVFSNSSLDGRGWDGKFNNEDQPEGVYIYVIDATFKDGQKEHHQGNISLIR